MLRVRVFLVAELQDSRIQFKAILQIKGTGTHVARLRLHFDSVAPCA